MGTSSSIAQEYYKVQDYWEEIEADKKWRLAVWVCQYHDVEIVDKFMEIERSVAGKFDDIFFRFDSEYKGDMEQFEKALYEEWAGWFQEKPDPSLDILMALKNDEMLLFEYQPNLKIEPTAVNLWKEMLRFKSSIDGIEEISFCAYFPPALPEGKKLTDWFFSVLAQEVPQGIRLTTIDYAQKRKVKLKASSEIKIIEPELKMAEAISNDMDKGMVSGNAVSTENRYALQIKRVMECTLKKSVSVLDREIKELFFLSAQMNSVSTSISTLMVAAQAYFMIQHKYKCEEYFNQAITESEQAMKDNDPAGYPVWRSAIMLKAALLAEDKKRREAIVLYERLAQEATNRADTFYIMESYRTAGHFYYELGELNTALETLLLSLCAGSYLDKELRRKSTFLLSAALALYLVRQIRKQEDIEILENSLEEWLGNDWKELVETNELENVKKRRKSSIFS